MKYIFTFLITIIFSFPVYSIKNKISINWKFFPSDVREAINPQYDDSKWRVLNLPHDWAFENGYSIDGAQTARGGYASGGIGSYRQYFDVDIDSINDKSMFIDFDGVYMNSEVWVNGEYMGKFPYGYMSFSYDITSSLKDGQNVIAVRVDNSKEPSARWYHGCGIYGNVYLRTENTSYFKPTSIFVRTPDADGKVLIDGCVNLDKYAGDYMIKVSVLDAKGETVNVGKSVSDIKLDKGENNFNLQTKVNNPCLWDTENPNLYTLNIKLENKDGKLMDEENIRFGFRTLEWKAESGFYLNGKQTKLRGVCEHLEGGPVGAMSTEQLLRWKLTLIKNMGCNSVRTAHNPQIPEFYDICDEMGILVFDEMFDGWRQKALHDYGAHSFAEHWENDLRNFIRRDRNHPSVFLYSVGNETKGDVAKDLVRVCHEEDPTRLVTSGDANASDMDIHGVNGNSERVKFLETYKPAGRAFLGTENPHTWQVRGYYRTKTWYRDEYPNKNQDPMYIPDLTEKEIFGYDWTSPDKRRNPKQIFNSSYDNATVRVTARKIIEMLRDKDWFSGSYRWTGFDYLGEAGFVHGGWPFRAFMGGALDLAGFEKDLYYLYQSEWADIDMVHILPHWTHPKMEAGTEIPVWVYTSGDEVELFLNGKSLGKKAKGRKWNEMQCEWMVPWTPGTIEAVAYRNGKEIARAQQRTSSEPVKLEISVENENLKADKENISIITVKEVDRNGTLYPYGENRVYTKVCGGARMLSFESGNPVDIETNFNATSKCCFFGLNRMFIQSTDTDASKPVSVYVGAVCGDKKLMTSDLISLSVEKVSLRDNKSKADLKVYYTTDGSTPTVSSKVYTGAFKVKLGTMVKAVVYDGDTKVFDMEERFAEDEGLYWGTPGEPVCNFKGDQAEYAELENCTKDIQVKGYEATGYVVPEPNKGSITWDFENTSGKDEAVLHIRYHQNGKNTFSDMDLYMNNNKVNTVRFNNDGNSPKWDVVKVPVKIVPGTNYIKLKSITDTVPFIDEIQVIVDK